MRQSFRIATRAVTVLARDGMKQGVRFRPNFVFITRQFSESFNPYPAAKTTDYQFQAVKTGAENDLINALNSGIVPNSLDDVNQHIFHVIKYGDYNFKLIADLSLIHI